jgi:hypothetical protein
MSKLTKRIKEVLENAKIENDGGVRIVLINPNSRKDKYVRGYDEMLKVVDKCKQHFDYYLLKRNWVSPVDKALTVEVVEHYFVVKDNAGKFVGVCYTMDLKDEPWRNHRIKFEYTDEFESETDFLESTKNRKDVFYFQKKSEAQINKNMKSKFDTIVEQILTPSQPAIKKVDKKITMYVYESGQIIGQEALSMRELKNRNIVTKVFEKYFGEGVVEEEDELEVQVTDGEIMIELNEEMFLNNTKFE